MSKTILSESQGTFQWYLDNLQRLGFYDITSEQYATLKDSIDKIETILNSLEVKD